MGYKKKNLETNGYKKKDFPQDFEFLADIVENCILCKDSAHDSISNSQLQAMSAITMEVPINNKVVFFNWISKWFTDAKMRKKEGKPLPKIYFWRIINILLKRKLR